MKKVFAIVCLLVVLVSAMAVAAEPANQNAWRLYIKAQSDVTPGANSNGAITFATNATASDVGGTGDTAITGATFTGFLNTSAILAFVEGTSALSVDAMSTKAPGNSAYSPTFEKVWDFRVGNWSQYAPVGIKLTMTQISSTAGVPALKDANNVPYRYFIRMVDNKGVVGAPANGKVWNITMPSAYVNATDNLLSGAATIVLPKLNVAGFDGEAYTIQSAANLMANGYKMQFVQTAVPEPGTVAAALALLAPAGLMFRRRRA